MLDFLGERAAHDAMLRAIKAALVCACWRNTREDTVACTLAAAAALAARRHP